MTSYGLKTSERKIEMKKHAMAVVAALFLVLLGTSAQASLVTENYSGTISYAASGNVFGVETNDSFTWSVTYDISYKDALGYLDLSDDADMKLSIVIGSRTFVETEDVFYGFGFLGAPILVFDSFDNIVGVSLLVDDYANDYRFASSGDGLTFTIYSIGADGFSSDVLLASGTFSFDAAPVPLPAAVWLLGPGLLGLLGLRRRIS